MIWKRNFSGPAGLEVGLHLLVIAKPKRKSTMESMMERSEQSDATLCFHTSMFCYSFLHVSWIAHGVFMNRLISPNYKKKARVFNQSVSLLLVETKTWGGSTRCGKNRRKMALTVFLFFVFVLFLFLFFDNISQLSISSSTFLASALATGHLYSANAALPLQLQHCPPPPSQNAFPGLFARWIRETNPKF